MAASQACFSVWLGCTASLVCSLPFVVISLPIICANLRYHHDMAGWLVMVVGATNVLTPSYLALPSSNCASPPVPISPARRTPLPGIDATLADQRLLASPSGVDATTCVRVDRMLHQHAADSTSFALLGAAGGRGKAVLNLGKSGGAAGLDDYIYDNAPEDDFDFM